jgi:hypothetical protein
MSPTQELEFHIRNYEAKYPNEKSPLELLIGRSAEELLAAFKLAKGKKLESHHFVITKRQQKKLAKLQMLEESSNHEQ